jgi:hypothetical protein
LQGILQAHLKYIRDRGYIRDRTSPVFPQKGGNKYEHRKLQYHLKKYLASRVGLEKIRQAGICRYYNELVPEGKIPRECLKRTSEFARDSWRHTKDILTGQIQPSGRKKDFLYQYMEEIEYFQLKDISDKLKIIDIVKDFCTRVENEHRLLDSQKKLLKEMMRTKAKAKGVDLFRDTALDQ